MKIVSDAEYKPAYEGCFSGEVLKESLKAAISPTEPEISVFHYHEGVISKWHSHPGGQSLYVLSESAIVGDQSGVTVVTEGELIITAPNERHFHGAVNGSGARLLTLTFGVTRWEESFPRGDELSDANHNVREK